MRIFTAKGQRSKEAKKQRELSFLCLFAPLLLCSKKFHHQFDHYRFPQNLPLIATVGGVCWSGGERGVVDDVGGGFMALTPAPSPSRGD